MNLQGADKAVAKADVQRLQDEVFYLVRDWDCFEHLFMHSDERSGILFESIPRFAGGLKLSLVYNIVTTLCRLTDDRPDTLTLTTTAVAYFDGSLKLKEEIKKLQAACKNIRRVRNKLIAHRDKDVAQGTKTLTLPELGNIRDAVRLAETVVVELGLAVDGTCVAFPGATVEHEMDLLHAYLAFGRRHQREVLELKQVLSSADEGIHDHH